MRTFYLAFPICDTLRHELSWSHYRILMRVRDAKAREWYMNECVACGWGTRELDRQVSRMFDDLVCQPDDKPTIGLVLCDETDPDIAKYSVLAGNDKLYAVKYSTVIPSEEVLRREIAAQKELFRVQMQDMALAKKLPPVHQQT